VSDEPFPIPQDAGREGRWCFHDSNVPLVCVCSKSGLQELTQPPNCKNQTETPGAGIVLTPITPPLIKKVCVSPRPAPGDPNFQPTISK
jgi:hypothetical protein